MMRRISVFIAMLLIAVMTTLMVVGCGPRNPGTDEGGGESPTPPEELVDRTPLTDTRTAAYKTVGGDGGEVEYASLYKAIDELMVTGEAGDYIVHIADNKKIYTNAPDSAGDIFYFLNESSYLKHGPWSQTFTADIQANAKTHTVNAKDGALNYSSYGIKSNKGVTSAAAWMFSKASPANVEIQPVLYSGIQKASFKAELTQAKVSPSYNKNQKTTARVGFLSQQGHVVGDLGIMCDTATGRWYLHTGVRDMEGDDIKKGEFIMDSTWNEEKKEFTPNDDVIISVEQVVTGSEAYVSLSVQTVTGNKTVTAKFENDKLEEVGTLAINASLNPNVSENGRFTYDLMNGSYLKNVRISNATGFVKEGLTDVNYDGNTPVLAAGEHKLHTLSDANSYTVVYNDEHATHAVEGEVDIINLDYSIAATAALSMIPINKVSALIEALPEPEKISSKDSAAITVAKKAFSELTADQKTLVSSVNKTKLELCETSLNNIVGLFTMYDSKGNVVGSAYGLFTAVDEMLVNKYEGGHIKDIDGNIVFDYNLSGTDSFWVSDGSYGSLGNVGWSAEGSKTLYDNVWVNEGQSVLRYKDGGSADFGKIIKRSFSPIVKASGTDMNNKDVFDTWVKNQWGALRNRVNYNRVTFAQAHSWADGEYQHKSMKAVYELSKSAIMPSKNPNQPAIAMLYFGFGHSEAAGKSDIGIYLDSSKVNESGKAEWKFVKAKAGAPFVFTDEVVMTATKNAKGEFITDADLQFDVEYIYGDAATAGIKLTVTPFNKEGVLDETKKVSHTYMLGAALGAGNAYSYGAAFTPDTWTNSRKTPDLTNGGYFKNVIVTEASFVGKDDAKLDMMFGNAASHAQTAFGYGTPNVAITVKGAADPVIFDFDYSRQTANQADAIEKKEIIKKEFDALSLTSDKINGITLGDAKIADYRALAALYVVTPFESLNMLEPSARALIKDLRVKIAALDKAVVDAAAAKVIDDKVAALALIQVMIDELTLVKTNIADLRALVTSYDVAAVEVKALVTAGNVTLITNLKAKLVALDIAAADADAAKIINDKVTELALSDEVINGLTLESENIASFRSIVADYNAATAEVKALVTEGNVALITILQAKLVALDIAAAAKIINDKVIELALSDELINGLTLESENIASFRSIVADYNAATAEVKALVTEGNVTLITSLQAKLVALDVITVE